MKTFPVLLFIAALSPAAILLPGCAKSDNVTSSAQNTKAAVQDLAASVKETAADSWESIKDYTHEKREDFAASLDRMAAKHDDDISALNAKLTGLPDGAAKQRDRANKEFKDARAHLKAQLAELRVATADTWSDAKGKVSQAWQHMQSAYENLKASPTS